MGAVTNTCVPSCSTDDDCERPGYGCYDANLDGRRECWFEGTGSGDYGDACEYAIDCGGVGQGAVCAIDNVWPEEPDYFCTGACGVGDVECPDGWGCSGDGICIRPGENQIGTSCEDYGDCTSAVSNPYQYDLCLIEDSPMSPSVDQAPVMEEGYCTLYCQEDADCAEGSRCTEPGDLFDDRGRTIAPFCVRGCEDDSDCPRQGDGCYDVNHDGQRECWPRGSGPATYDEPCQWGSECGGVGEYAVCRFQGDDEQGRCSQYCGRDPEGCPGGYACHFEIDGWGQFISTCVRECDDDSDCAPGMECVDEFIHYDDFSRGAGCR